MMRIVFKQIRLLTRILSSIRIFKNFIARNIVLHETCCSLSNLLHEDSTKTINNILRNHQASKKKLSYPNLFAKNSPLIFCNTSLLSPFHRSDVVYMLSKPFEINPGNSRSPPKAFDVIKPRRKRLWKTIDPFRYQPKSQRSCPYQSLSSLNNPPWPTTTNLTLSPFIKKEKFQRQNSKEAMDVRERRRHERKRVERVEHGENGENTIISSAGRKEGGKVFWKRGKKSSDGDLVWPVHRTKGVKRWKGARKENSSFLGSWWTYHVDRGKGLSWRRD